MLHGHIMHTPKIRLNSVLGDRTWVATSERTNN